MQLRTFMLSLAVACSVAVAAPAQAQDLSLRVEPGFAAPLNTPQTDHYGDGAAASLKLDLHIDPWVTVFPSATFVGLSIGDKYTPGGEIGTAWALGAGLRITRPHDYQNNPDHGLDAFAPWVDAQPVYVRTNDLNRFGVQAGAGIYFPTSDSRWLWTGPFVGYQEITDGTAVGGDSNKDNTDSRVAILGWGFEFEPFNHSQPTQPAQPEVKKDVTEVTVWHDPVPQEAPPPARHDVQTFGQVDLIVPFEFDSSVIAAVDQDNLKEFSAAIKQKLANHHWKMVISGYASDEGHKWATAHNQALSEQRAQAVHDFLVGLGVPNDNLVVKGLGTSHPIGDNKTEEGRKLNRRVEFFVTVTVSCTDDGDCQ